MSYSLLALCPQELKGALADELKRLGAYEIEEGFKAVFFKVSERDYYRVHLYSGIASSFLRVVKSYGNVSVKGTFNLSRKIPWSDFLSERTTYRIDANMTERGQDFPSSNEFSKQVRLGIEEHFKKKDLPFPKVSLSEPQVIITAFYAKGNLVFGFNTSRMSLHKRGYRVEGHPAPMKETMASALLDLIGYDGSQAFLDPMCGSGTIAIEACYKALKKAPNIHRKKGQFGFEYLKDFNSSLWRELQDEARQGKLENVEAPIFASDIDPKFTELAQKSALKARAEKYMSFQTASFFDLEKPAEEGILLTNLPYGERLKEEDFKEFYKSIGDHLKKNFSGWKVGLFVAEESPWKFIGLKPKRKYPLLNGSIKTKLLVFEMYQGSRKKKSEPSD